MGRQQKFLKILSFSLLMGMVFKPFSPAVASTQIDIIGPPGSGEFGYSVSALSNGNIVICDPYYDDGDIVDVGAVYLYNGASGEQISMLTGSKIGDLVCYGGVTLLENGNFVVRSPYWDNGSVWDAGAVTWGDGRTGISGVINPTNSLVGSTDGDEVGWMTALKNGNYVVRSPYWDNGMAEDAGAVTWGNGTTGTVGIVSPDNSLVGSQPRDWVGGIGITELTNGNYVVPSYLWDNGLAEDAGAITWGDGTKGIAGVISEENSLVGSTAYDHIGDYYTVTPLTNGNYVVHSSEWDNGAVKDAGAVTWGDGSLGISGSINANNSLVGTTTGDLGHSYPWGFYGVTALSNGNYLVGSPDWDNGAAKDAGAVTWGNGSLGIKGSISAENSLVGGHAYDRIGISGVLELTNGNYLVSTPTWYYGEAPSAGAVTWGDGTKGINGVVSPANSLVGSKASDYVGSFGAVTALSNGNYLVISVLWDNGTFKDAGAATWGNGTTGTTGVVSPENSLVGSTSEDQIGMIPPIVLSNGNFVVLSPYWDNGEVVDAGAATWGNGESDLTGVISEENSLVGSTDYDAVGFGYPLALTNGNYVVGSQYWDNGDAVDAGAATWGNGETGITGVVNPTNSLVGSTSNDQVGSEYTQPLPNGNYIIRSPLWDNGLLTDAGAVTWGDGMQGITGTISATNSLVGSTSGDQVGSEYETWLTNDNYVLSSPWWDNGDISEAGAVTWGDSSTGVAGEVSADNSLVGSSPDDQVGSGGVTALPDGNYVVLSPLWNNGSVTDSGAITWGYRSIVTGGSITADNSVRGTSSGGGQYMNFTYNLLRRQLVVGRPSDNIVTLFRPERIPIGPYEVYVPMIAK